MHLASWNGHVAVVELLAWHGGDVNQRNTYCWKPFHCACFSNHSAIVEVLTAVFDADFESPDEYYAQTALTFSVSHNKVETTRLLLALNADTAKSTSNGWNVSRTKNEEIKELLLARSNTSVRP